MKRLLKSGLTRVWLPVGTLGFFAGCGLSDQQLTSIAQSVITTALNSFVTQGAAVLFDAVSNGAGG